MSISQPVILNISSTAAPPILYMSQGDAGSRVISATLFDGAVPFTIPEGTTAMVRYGKPDGTGGMYDHDELDNEVTYSESVVTAPVAAQMLTAAGRVMAEIDLYSNSNAVKLAAFPFVVTVIPSAKADAEIISSDYYNILAADIADIKRAHDEIIEMTVSSESLPSTQQASVTKTIIDGVINLMFGIPAGVKGGPGDPGPTGIGIRSIALFSGTHAAGTTDTYRVTYTNDTYFDFEVYNGANGSGTGDMQKSVYDPENKAGQVAMQSDLTTHATDTVKHITDAERTAWNGKSNKSTLITATLQAASWVGAEAPFTYTLAVPGVTTTSNQEILPALDITQDQLEALQVANIVDGGQSLDTMVLKAWGTVPDVDVPIRIILRGDS